MQWPLPLSFRLRCKTPQRLSLFASIRLHCLFEHIDISTVDGMVGRVLIQAEAEQIEECESD